MGRQSLEEGKKAVLKSKIVLVTLFPIVFMALAIVAEVFLFVKDKLDFEDKLMLLKGILIIVVITVIITTIFMRVMIWEIVSSLHKSIKVLSFAANGNLTTFVDEKEASRMDEMGDLASSVNTVISSLKNLIGQARDTSDTILESSQRLEKMTIHTTNASDDVARSMGEMANAATSQANETQMVSDAVIKIGEGIEQTSIAVNGLLSNADQMRKAGRAGAESVEDLENISHKVKSQIAIIYEQTNTTNVSALEIHKATELISSIASETNLLALNASIEAARAGESGRGFAVVAEQIKNLAEQSSKSAKTIEAVIKKLIEESEQAVKTMNTVDAIIGLQSDKVETTKEVFDKVNEGLEITISGVEGIADNTKMLDDAREQVLTSVANLSAYSQENAATTQETAATAEELAASISETKRATESLYEAADKLNADLNVFQLYM